MTADGPSTVSADDSQQSAEGRGAGEGPSGLPRRTAGSLNGNAARPATPESGQSTANAPADGSEDDPSAAGDGATVNGRALPKRRATADRRSMTEASEDAVDDRLADEPTAADEKPAIRVRATARSRAARDRATADDHPADDPATADDPAADAAATGDGIAAEDPAKAHRTTTAARATASRAVTRDAAMKDAGDKDASANSAGTKEAPESPATGKDATAQDATAKDAATKDPATKDPATKDPATKDPATKDPATKDPATMAAATKDPAKNDAEAKDAGTKDGAATDAAAKDVNASADASAGDGSGRPAPADRKKADKTDGSAVAVDERPADAGAPSPSIDPESTEDPESTDLSRERDVVSSGVLVKDAAAQDVAEAVVNDPWVRAPGEKKAADDVVDIDSGVSKDDIVAVEVAHQFEAVVGEDSDADPAEFAATAVLDVLRASGWADIAEATELRAESARLRELLSEVIRDHRAREASMAGVENQQLHWLVPLLRAAHGVAFGSLGAKVALRTAVQDVPPEVLRSAGLRIDYGVTHDYGAEHDYEDDR